MFSVKDGWQDRQVQVPCGQCLGCRIRKSRDWALRSMHESQMHETSCFITLTYDAEHLPEDRGVDAKEWKRFADRLRLRMGPFRFMHCGEYGAWENDLRPHYHACLYGVDFAADRIPWKKSGKNMLYVSPTLGELWPYGFSSIGDVTFDSAAYVAGYVTKKITGKGEDEANMRLDPETGEVWRVNPPYMTSSRRPGLGKKWFEKFWRDVYPDDFVVAKGFKFRPPRYYDELYRTMDKESMKEIEKKRRWVASSSPDDHTARRQWVKERVLEEGVKNRKRDL